MNDEAAGTKALMAQLSGIIVTREMKIAWEPLAAEYQLAGLVDSHLIRKNHFGDWDELGEAIWKFLNRCYSEKPQDALRFFQRLAHEVASDPSDPQCDELMMKYPIVFSVASQPIGQGHDIPIIIPTWSEDPFIIPTGYTGHFLRIVTEINKSFVMDCNFATAILSRKLIESLVVSIMQKKYGSNHRDYYMKRDNRFKFISVILKKFWELFDTDFMQYSSVTDRATLDQIKLMIDELIIGFNVSVHHLGAYTNKNALLGKKNDLRYVLDFLKYLDDHV